MAKQTTTYSVSLYNRDYSTANSYGSRTTAYMGQYGTGYVLTGIMYITNLTQIDWTKQTISSISLRLKHGTAGNYTGKTFFFWSSKIQDGVISNRKGSDFVNEFLGQIEVDTNNLAEGIILDNLSSNLKDNFITFSLSNSLNSSLFKNLVKYFQTGEKTTICLYNNEISGNKEYSTNYLSVTEAAITITYSETPKGSIYYGVDNNWKQCLVYYGINGKWQQVIPHYGANGEWQHLGGE